MRRSKNGSAIAMVMVFLAIVGLIAIATSSQSSFVRKTTARSFYGFEAVEVCESAVNEVHSTVQMKDLFTANVVTNLQAWCLALIENDIPKLQGTFGEYQYLTRPVIKADGTPDGRQLFVCMMWPEANRPLKANNFRGKLFERKADTAETNAKSLPGFKKLSPVEVSVLSWRRDKPPGGAWQDWGVVHYRVSAEFDDGKNTVVRTMHVDRMFSLYAHFRGGECPPGNPCPGGPVPCSAVAGQPKIDPHDPPDPADVRAAEANECPDKIFVHFLKSRSNLKTVILRS